MTKLAMLKVMKMLMSKELTRQYLDILRQSHLKKVVSGQLTFGKQR